LELHEKLVKELENIAPENDQVLIILKKLKLGEGIKANPDKII